MKPDPLRVLETVSMMLIMEFVPQLPTSYAQQALAGGATILAAAREEIDRAAARRIEENRALRRLFADGARRRDRRAISPRASPRPRRARRGASS